jgi:hypothetical protein
MIRLRTKPHPISEFLAVLIFGPFLLAIALVIVVTVMATHLLAMLLHFLGRRAD